MFTFSSPVGKAAFDLASIGLVWAGTLAITFGGIPALVSVFLAGADGAQLLGADGALVMAAPDPAAVDAYRRYMRWAWFGMSLITLGAFWQAMEPAQTIRVALQRWWRT